MALGIRCGLPEVTLNYYIIHNNQYTGSGRCGRAVQPSYRSTTAVLRTSAGPVIIISVTH